MLASLLPCQWDYWEIGDHLAKQGPPRNAPLYVRWIEMYTSEEFSVLAHHLRDMGEAYLTSVRLEHRFWDMAYNLEEWEV